MAKSISQPSVLRATVPVERKGKQSDSRNHIGACGTGLGNPPVESQIETNPDPAASLNM